MSSANESSRLLLPVESVNDELSRLKITVCELEEEAVRKDQLLSQIMSRLREYEMGEYGLAEAVTEIKECKKVIRARDREIERLTDEINLLKLHISLSFENKDDNNEIKKRKTGFDNENAFLKDEKYEIYEKTVNEVKHESHDFGKHKSCQCHISIYPSAYNEEICTNKLQNEKLRLELSQVCENAVESITHLQKNNQLSQHKSESFIKKLKDQLVKLKSNTVLSEKITSQQYSPRNRNEEKSNDFNSFLRTVKGNHEIKENILEHVSLKDSDFVQQLARNWKFCKESSCKDKVVRLMDLEIKLLNEILLLKKLLEISHHQTQELETMCFTQVVQIKALQSQLTLSHGKNDDKVLLGKLAMKVLQLQFKQAACLFELKKIKSDERHLQEWYKT